MSGHHDCDENCNSCPQCYVKTGEGICDMICPCSMNKPIIHHMSTPSRADNEWIKQRFTNEQTKKI